MIRTDKIQAELLGCVGFKNPTISGYHIVDEDNASSASGLYFGDSSSLVTIKNIKDCQEDANIGDEDFNLLLKDLQKSVALEVCNKIIEGKSDFIGSYNLFPFEKSFKNTIEPEGKFVGFCIEPSNTNVALSIPFVELSFNAEKTFNVYLYHSNKPKAPIKTKEVTTVAGESVLFPLDWIIADDPAYKGGSFFLGYFENDLDGAKAYKRDYETSILGVYTPYFSIEPASLDCSGTTIDITTEEEKSDTFGLSLIANVYNDYTELLLRNKNLLYQPIQLQMHEKVLNLIKYSPRSNVDQRIAKESIDFELFGNSTLKIDGVISKLNRSIDQVKKAMFYVPRIQRATAAL